MKMMYKNKSVFATLFLTVMAFSLFAQNVHRNYAPDTLYTNGNGDPVLNGGYGSAFAAVPGDPNSFYMLTDRGPNVNGAASGTKVFPVPAFNPQIAKFTIVNDSLVKQSVINLKRADGTLLTGLPNPQGYGSTGEMALNMNGDTLAPDTFGVDSEALIACTDGTFWMADEYGPHIVHFDANGNTIERINPFGNGTGGRSLPLVFAKRRANRGMEGLTITPDGTTLVGMMQSTMYNPSKTEIVNKKLTRIVTFNIATGATQQFVYMQEANALANSEITALTDSTFVVLERDGLFPGHASNPAVYKRFYKININGATDVSDPANGEFGLMFDGGTKTLEQMTDSALAANGIVPVTKELVIDLLVDMPNYPHDKPEGLVIVDNTTIAICNDDDFGILKDGTGGYVSKVLPMNGLVDYNAVYFATVAPLVPAPVAPAEINFAEEVVTFEENEGTVTVDVVVSNNTAVGTSFSVQVIEATAVENTDFTFTSTINVPASVGTDTTVQVAITLTDNMDAAASKFFTLELVGSNLANVGDDDKQIVYILDEDYAAPVATQAISLNPIASYMVKEDGSAEILAYDAATQKLFVVNSIDTELMVLDFSNPYSITTLDTIDMSIYGAGITSVATCNGTVAVAVENGPLANGSVVFLNTDGTHLSTVPAGNLPDNVSFVPGGMKVLTANEGQPDDDYLNDPEGTVTVIDMTNGAANLTAADATTLNFNAFDAQIAALQSAGVRVFGPNATVSQDVEPEYVTYNTAGTKAYVALQENNAIAVVDLTIPQITDIWPMGYKDHMLAGNEFDGSDKTDTVIMANWPVKGMYMPDAIASYEVAGQLYIVTTNEGDAREYDGFEEEIDIADITLDSAAFPCAFTMQSKYGVGRMATTTSMGDTDNDGDYDEVYVYGGRSFSIYNATTGAQVYDSGDDFERIISEHPVWAELFNASNSNNNYKNRSDNKGPEPEAITIHEVNGIPYAFIGLERMGGIMTYDISNPTAPVFVDYVNTRDLGADEGGDLGPEGIIYIPFNESPTDSSLIVVANEVSSTISVYTVEGEILPTPADPMVDIVVIADPHYMDTSLLINDGTAFQTYLAMDRKMLAESHAIMEAAIDTILQMDPDILLVPGDLTKDGAKVSHEALAGFFSTLESNGIEVFLAPGNHDINNTHAVAFDGANTIPVDYVTPAQFDSIYADFGYNEAIASDPNSLSYVAEPYPGFQILSMDVCIYDNNIAGNYPTTGGEIPYDTYIWITEQIQAAQDSGKYMVGMMHHGIVEHYQGQTIMFPDYVVSGWDTLSENFADLGLKAVFTGHYHAQDIVRKETVAGQEIFDIETGSLVTWPAPFRNVTVNTDNGDVAITGGKIQHINYNTGGASFQDYAYNFLATGFPNLVNYILTNPPYSLDAATAANLEPVITEAFMAHYHGNEGDPSPASQAVLNSLVGTPLEAFYGLVMSLWNDPAPDDWNFNFNLNMLTPAPSADFMLTIFHNNDGESKLIDAGNGMEDFGGVARFKTVLENLRDEADTTGNSYVTLSSGDNFLAGPQFNAGLYNPAGFIYDGIVIDSLNYDAVCLGNHDFDFGPAVLADFINDVQVNQTTFLSANLDFSNEAALSPLAQNGKIADRKVVMKDGRKIGIVGLTTPMLANISSPGNTIIETNIDSVLQVEVNHLKTVDSCNIIILISHLQDLQADTLLIQNMTDVDVVIAGGGDEILGSAGDALTPVDSINGFSGTYPLEFADASGDTVYVVTTPGEYRYVGRLMLNFNEAGEVTFVDPASSMVLVDNTVAPDAGLQNSVVTPVENYVAGLVSNVIATSEVDLDGIKAHVRSVETNEGNLAADAMLWQAQQLATSFGANMPNVCLQNGGGIRNNNIIAAGDFTELNTFEMLPFSNFVSVVEDVTPTLFKEVLENCVSAMFNGGNIGSGRFAQVGGFSFVYDTTAQSLAYDVNDNLIQQGERIWTVTLNDGTPIVVDGQVVANAPNLNIAIANFLANGGDQYPLSNNNMVSLGVTYQQALYNYVVNELNGLIAATDYPEGGEGRITYKDNVFAPWTYTVTSDDHTILIPDTVMVNGMTLEAGDYFGVFYYANGVAHCGGYVQWDGNTNALSAWGADLGNDGFANGEDFKWRIYDASAGMEYRVAATYNTIDFTEDAYFTSNGISGVVSFDVVEDSQFVLLQQGWSIISTYIDPVDPNAVSVFADVVAHNALVILKDEIGNVYWPAFILNAIGDLAIGEAYKVKTNAVYLLEVVGEKVTPETTPLTLDAGWSLFGYLRTSSAPIVDMMSDVASSVRLIKNSNGLIYWPQFGINQVVNMHPGEGYKVNMFATETLYYAPNTMTSKAVQNSTPKTTTYLMGSSSENDMSLLIPASAWKTLPSIGDEIGIFASNGQLLGSTVFTGSHSALTIWGRNDADARISEGETFTIKVWSKINNLSFAGVNCLIQR